MQRSSTALSIDGRVWLVDPERAPGIADEIRALGTPAGIISTVGWHDRDVDWFASLLNVPVYGASYLNIRLFRTPMREVASVIPGTPLRVIDASMRGVFSFWREGAIWWPETRTLITGDSIGTASYFVGDGGPAGVHPLMRLSPPRALAGLDPLHLYCGHGPSLHHGAGVAVDRAVHTARSGLLKAWMRSIAPRSTASPSTSPRAR